MTYGKGRSTPIKTGSEMKLPISTDSGITMKYRVINKEWKWFLFIDESLTSKPPPMLSIVLPTPLASYVFKNAKDMINAPDSKESVAPQPSYIQDIYFKDIL
jgi:hypothetical protein